MSDPLDVHRTLELCMQTIEAGREAMAHDMYDAAMRLGAAEMMLASASRRYPGPGPSLSPRGLRNPTERSDARTRTGCLVAGSYSRTLVTASAAPNGLETVIRGEAAPSVQ